MKKRFKKKKKKVKKSTNSNLPVQLYSPEQLIPLPAVNGIIEFLTLPHILKFAQDSDIKQKHGNLGYYMIF